MKVDQSEEEYIYIRRLKDIDKDHINHDIINHDQYDNTLIQQDSDKVAIAITRIVKDVFQNHTPLVKVKISQKKVPENNVVT